MLRSRDMHSLVECGEREPKGRPEERSANHKDGRHLECGVHEDASRRWLCGGGSAVGVVNAARARKESCPRCGQGFIVYGSERVGRSVVMMCRLGGLMQGLWHGLHVWWRANGDEGSRRGGAGSGTSKRSGWAPQADTVAPALARRPSHVLATRVPF